MRLADLVVVVLTQEGGAMLSHPISYAHTACVVVVPHAYLERPMRLCVIVSNRLVDEARSFESHTIHHLYIHTDDVF